MRSKSQVRVWTWTLLPIASGQSVVEQVPKLVVSLDSLGLACHTPAPSRVFARCSATPASFATRVATFRHGDVPVQAGGLYLCEFCPCLLICRTPGRNVFHDIRRAASGVDPAPSTDHLPFEPA